MSGEHPKPPEQTRVLVVEDVARLRGFLVSAIPEMGYLATAARTAEDAIRIMEREAHDIAVLDLNLPGMDGMDFLDVLRHRWPETQVIILTGFGDLEAARRAIRLDVVDFLTKPASLGDVETALDRARRRQLQSGERPPAATPPPSAEPVETRTECPRALREAERDLILAALTRNQGNRAATAAELDISLRTLYYRLAEYQREGKKARRGQPAPPSE